MRRGVLWSAVTVLMLCFLFPHFNHASPNVAFMGDSITQGWTFPRANFGIYGQTTAQMLARFPTQICKPAPGQSFREVVIEGGTNDTLLHLDPRETLSNLSSMVDLARAAGIEPVLAEIPPILRGAGAYSVAVNTLNAGIFQLAHAKGVRVVDYFDALKDHPSAITDGVHLRHRGYFLMEWALLRSAGAVYR